MYAQASLALTNDERREVFKLAEVGKDFLLQKTKAFVAAAAGRPLLYSYSSDGTPMLTKTTYAQKVTEARSVRRTGGYLHEFLVQRCALKYHSADGTDKVCCYTRDPVPLDKGKTAWFMYSAAVAFFPLCRELGHRGIVVSHYCFDRAYFTALERKMRQRHELHYRSGGAGEPMPPHSRLLQLCDWQVATGCACHDCQNGLKWSMAGFLADPKNGLKDLYVVVDSLKNAFDLLVGRIHQFLAVSVGFDPDPVDPSEISEFWSALGVEPDVLEVLCDLNPVWRDSVLWVSNRHRNNADLMEQLSGILLYLFRFRKFSESRWTTIGETAKVIVGSLRVGLEGLVHMIRQDPKSSDFHIGGFSRLTPELVHFCTVASVAAHVPDSILVDLLEDDRVARRIEALEETLADELAWVASLSESFWKRLASVEGKACFHRTLRSDCVVAASIGAAYIKRGLFNVARSYPWSLAIGNIEANLSRLMQEENVQEPTALKVQALAAQGFNRAALVDGLMLLRDCHWSTVSVEQGHGSAAALHKHHKAYGHDMLMARSFLHMTKPLLASDDSLGVGGRAASAQLQALDKKQPNKVTGRHLFLKDLMQQAQQALPPGRLLSQADKTNIMAQHGALWQQCSPSQQRGWEKQAEALVAQQAEKWQGERSRLQASLALQRKRLSEEALAQGSLCRLSASRLSPPELQALQASFASPAWGPKAVERLRAIATTPPEEPSAAAKAALESMGSPAVDARPSPAWGRTVCRNRDAFARCALLLKGGLETQAYAFMYASQSPMFAAFVPLQALERPLPCLSPATFAAADLGHYAFDWTFAIADFVWDADIQVPEGIEIWVVPQLVFREGLVVSSHSAAVKFATYVQGLPAPSNKPASSSASRPSGQDVDLELLARFPWLADHLRGQAARNDRVTLPIPDADAPEADPEGEDLHALDQDALDKAYADLMAKRRDMELSEPVGAANFLVKVRGGPWMRERPELQGVRGEARSKPVEQWCREFFLPASATFAFTAHGGNASILAREWCARMEYFYGLWRQHAPHKVRFTEEDVRGYEPRQDFVSAMAALPPEHASAQRGKLLATLAPKLG